MGNGFTSCQRSYHILALLFEYPTSESPPVEWVGLPDNQICCALVVVVGGEGGGLNRHSEARRELSMFTDALTEQRRAHTMFVRQGIHVCGPFLSCNRYYFSWLYVVQRGVAVGHNTLASSDQGSRDGRMTLELSQNHA